MDYYAITLPVQDTLEIIIGTDATMEADVTLYDSNGASLASDCGWGPLSTVTVENLPAGTYYVYIEWYSGYGGYAIAERFHQPDAQIRASTVATYTGNNLYNVEAAQTVQQSKSAGEKAVYYLKLQNDGAWYDTLTISGEGSESGMTVAYYSALTGGTNITAAVTGSGWTTSQLTRDRPWKSGWR